MSKKIFCGLLAIATTPIFVETVSSTSIIITSEKDRQFNNISVNKQSTLEQDINISQTITIRNSWVKVPSIAIVPQTETNFFSFSNFNQLINSVTPISSNVETEMAVFVAKNTSSTFQVDSSVTSQFPKFSRHSLFSKNSHNSNLVHPAPKTERIASVFGWRIRPFSGTLQMHQGIDYGAPLGSSVVAARDGIVTKVVSGCLDFRQRLCGSQFGNWIEIDHGDGMVTTYAHLLHNSITVEEGTKVWQNQEIALVGSSGWSTGAHLDFRIKVNSEYKNPADYVNN